jgi:hypothetical protein
MAYLPISTGGAGGTSEHCCKPQELLSAIPAAAARMIAIFIILLVLVLVLVWLLAGGVTEQ